MEKFKQYLETDLLPHLGGDSVLVMDKYEVAPCKGGEKSAGQFRLVSFTWICAFILKIAIFLIFV